jgi:hypothetical protein
MRGTAKALAHATTKQNRYNLYHISKGAVPMFCPNCKAEYIDGISECADCHVPLVQTLPDERQGKAVEWEPLVSSPNMGDLALIKSLLQSEGILYWVQGENRALVPHGIPFGAMVHVEKSQHTAAKKLIQNLDLNNFSFSIRNSDEID